MDYVHFYPVKHGHVTFARDWPSSNFHRTASDGLYPPDWGASNIDDFLVGEP